MRIAALSLLFVLGLGRTPQDAAPIKKLDAVAFMAGHWRQDMKGASVEELWLPPKGGLMLGLNRTVAGSKKVFFEFLRLAEDEKGVVYWASPNGSKATPFRLMTTEKNRAVFENADHDFPNRIEYRLAEGKLVASISGDTSPGTTWSFTRVAKVE